MPKQPNHQPIYQAAKDLTEHPAEPPDHSGQSGGPDAPASPSASSSGRRARP